MFTDILLPFLLTSNFYGVKHEPDMFSIEYEFNFHYYLRLKELGSSIQLTGKLICHSMPYSALRCFLQDVKSKQPKYRFNGNGKLKLQYVETDYEFSEPFWFDIFFNDKIGAHAIRIRDKYWKLVKGDIQVKERIRDLIKSIAYLFKIDSRKISKNLILESTTFGSSVFTNTETSIVGTCETEYYVTVEFNESNDLSLLIIPQFLTPYFTERRDIHVQIEKHVKSQDKKDKKCDIKRSHKNSRWTNVKDIFIYDIKMIDNIYKMEIINNKVNISNRVIVQLPNLWSSKSFLLYQETSLNLTDVRYAEIIKQFNWDDFDGIGFSV